MKSSILPTLAIAAVLTACGGPGSTRPASKSPSDESEESPTTRQGPQLPNCDDGSCFHCGDTVCLPGYYCETNGEISGCAWNATCAKDATCGCLQGELRNDPRCTCEERGGNAFVSCED